MTILAVWFGVAVVVGVLLGYAARRLKRAPEQQLKAGDANIEDRGDQHEQAYSRQSSLKTNKFYRRLWRT